MKKIQITKQGFSNLQIELEHLQKNKRPIIIEKLQKARAMGDLKENNAYHAAREELGELEGRMLEINHILKHAEIVQGSLNTNQITLGSTIEVDTQGTHKTFQIVGEFEADPMNGKISQTSPIGKSLLGKKEGDAIELHLPNGSVQYRILAVR